MVEVLRGAVVVVAVVGWMEEGVLIGGYRHLSHGCMHRLTRINKDGNNEIGNRELRIGNLGLGIIIWNIIWNMGSLNNKRIQKWGTLKKNNNQKKKGVGIEQLESLIDRLLNIYTKDIWMGDKDISFVLYSGANSVKMLG